MLSRNIIRCYGCIPHFQTFSHHFVIIVPKIVSARLSVSSPRIAIEMVKLPIVRRVGTGGGAVRGGMGGRCCARNCVWVCAGAAGDDWLLRGLLGSGEDARLDSELPAARRSSRALCSQHDKSSQENYNKTYILTEKPHFS